MQYTKQVPQGERYDVIVAGGGPAGIGAGLAAAGAGLKTLLLERGGCLGGMATAGALPFILGTFNGSIPFRKMVAQGLRYTSLPLPARAVDGVYGDFVRQMQAQGPTFGPAAIPYADQYPGLDRLGCHDEFTFDIEDGKRVLDQMAAQAGLRVAYFTTAVDVDARDDVLHGLYAHNKEGLHYYAADAFIDCTGDADLVHSAGFATYKGDRESGGMAHAGLLAHIEGIDLAALASHLQAGNDPWFYEVCEKARAAYPERDLPTYLIMMPMVQQGVVMVNGGMSFDNVDGTLECDVSWLMARARARAHDLITCVFRPFIPGAQDCRLRLTSSLPGIRETRRIVGERTLTEADLLSGHHFPDAIALAGRHFDLQRADGQAFHKKDLHVKGGMTEIPYGALVPKGARNLLVAGRCIAADGQALGPARIMSTCMATGQAAGLAAALKTPGGSFAEIDIEALRRRLQGERAIVAYQGMEGGGPHDKP